jgi:hypothetical protein
MGVVFLSLSAVICLGAYLGWFGWFLWGRPKRQVPPPVITGSEAQAFAERLKESKAVAARTTLTEIRGILDNMNKAKQSRYEKYAEEVKYRRKQTPDSLSALESPPVPEDEWAVETKLDKLDLRELYAMAVHLDKMLHQSYRSFRSCELARLQDMTLKEAYAVSDIIAPEHRPINEEVYNAPIRSTNGEAMKRLKEELQFIEVEIRSISSAANRMKDLAAILEPGLFGMGQDLAMNNSDMTLWGTHLLVERPPSRFIGTTGTDPNAFEHEWGRGDGPITKKELGLPVNFGVDLSKSLPLPGRKLLKSGRKDEWMFINAWYVCGPFPNPQRRNLEQKFPPEASIDPTLGFVGIDLDAKYVGMGRHGEGTRTIEWEFVATDRRVCYIPQPPEEWAIWYAYTEIWCDKDQERWCIFGSDDFGKCWVNGKEVFTSGVTPHPWVPDRDHAKVQFKKGFNVVLFKLENAWGRTGWSFCIYTGEVGEEGG